MLGAKSPIKPLRSSVVWACAKALWELLTVPWYNPCVSAGRHLTIADTMIETDKRKNRVIGYGKKLAGARLELRFCSCMFP